MAAAPADDAEFPAIKPLQLVIDWACRIPV